MLVDRICAHCGESFQTKDWKAQRFCSKSCGAHVSKNRRHGLSDNPEHRTWTRIRERCNNPSHGDYPKYGGRGIKVCERWDSFENFLADMGPRNGLTIDRYPDSNGNYEPGNCRWATRTEQSRNRGSYTYSAEQDQKIREAIALGYNFPKMAKYVGRSVTSVMCRTYRLGLKSGQRVQTKITDRPATDGARQDG
jgi:hypothetical protein